MHQPSDSLPLPSLAHERDVFVEFLRKMLKTGEVPFPKPPLPNLGSEGRMRASEYRNPIRTPRNRVRALKSRGAVERRNVV